MSGSLLSSLDPPRLTAAEQYRAAVETCAWVDLTDRTQLEVRGRDRAAFLHNFTTQEIKRLAAGEGCEAFVTNIKGRIVGHVFVFAGEEAHWLDGPPGSAATLLPHFDRYIITEDVQFADRSGEWGEAALLGPRGGELVEALVPGSSQWPPFRHDHREGVTVRAAGFTRQPGWLVGAAIGRLTELCRGWITAGVPQCSAEVFEALRIEAAFPWYGVDLTEENLAHEAGRTRQAISFTKGCYLGQEPIARLEAMGHTNRELRVIRLATTDVVERGAKVVDSVSGAECGMVTSAAVHPGELRCVALAMLRREVCNTGNAVQVMLQNGRAAGEVQ